MNKLYDFISKAAPTVAGLLGGPPAALVASGLMEIAGKVLGVSGGSETFTALQNADPEQLAQIENALIIRLRELEIAELTTRLTEATKQIESVNQTMRSESVAVNWPTWTWRPFLGFVAGVMILGDYFILPLAGIPVPMIPVEVWTFLAAVLGIASFGHSKALADPSNHAVTKG